MLTLKSFPKETPAVRRRRLILATLRAWKQWEHACYTLADAKCAFSCDATAVHAAHSACTHRFRRYNMLESVLANEANLPKDTVYNEIANWAPDATRLIRAVAPKMGEAA
jgi:hypothetical protein